MTLISIVFIHTVAGPDILGGNWCPTDLPYATEAVISGSFHNVFGWEDKKFSKAPWMVTFFG